MRRMNCCLLQLSRRVLCGLLAVLILFFMTGCSWAGQEEKNSKILRVLVEKNDYWDTNGLEYQIELAIQHFAKEYPDYKIVLEELPKPENGRAEMLQKLQA